MPVERVVVEVQLGIKGEQITAGRDDERIDLEQRGVGGDESLIQRHHHLDGLANLVALQPQIKREPPRLVGLQAECRVDERLENLVRGLGGDFLNLDAALLAHHQHRLLGRPVDDQAQVELAGDLQAFFDQHALDDAAFRAGLDR